MQAGGRNPQACISFEAIALVEPDPSIIAGIESAVDRAMAASGPKSEEATIPATAFASLANPPGRWNAFGLSFLLQAALLLVLANTTIFLLQPTLKRVDTMRIVHLVAPDRLSAPEPTKMNVEVTGASVPRVATPPRFEVRISRIALPLIPPPKLLLDPEKATLPATRTPAGNTRAFRGPDLAAVPLTSREIVPTSFGGDSAPAAEGKSTRQVQTGGFGDRNGVQVTAGSTGKSPMLAKVGAFDMPNGPGSGNGTGGAKGVRSTSTSASFGSATDGRRGPACP